MARYSMSRMDKFQRCRLAWSLSEDGYRSGDVIAPLAIGRAFHDAAERYYKHGLRSSAGLVADLEAAMVKARGQGDEKTADKIEKYLSTADCVFTSYTQECDRLDEGYSVIGIERYFAIEDAKSGFEFSGIFDLVLRNDETGNIRIIDHKTTSRVNDYSSWLFNRLQTWLYLWAADQLYDAEVEGFEYRLITTGSFTPSDDLILQNGAITSDKRKIDHTTVSDLAEAVVQQGLPVEDYQHIIDEIADGNTAMRSWFLQYDQRLVDQQMNFIRARASVMDNDPAIYPSANSWVCRMCQYENYCRVLHLRGEDSDEAKNELRALITERDDGGENG